MNKKQVQKLVNLVRGAMKILSKQMVDMENAIGVDTWYQTKEGAVRALTYGFENPEVTPLLVNIHGSGFVMGSAAMDDPFMMQFVEKCNVKLNKIAAPQPWQAIAQRFCSIPVCRSVNF